VNLGKNLNARVQVVELAELGSRKLSLIVRLVNNVRSKAVTNFCKCTLLDFRVRGQYPQGPAGGMRGCVVTFFENSVKYIVFFRKIN
jgi:hypothetical protein